MTAGSLLLREWRLAVLIGIVIGIVYALSPLTVWFTLAMMLVAAWARRGLDGVERRWVTIVLVVAIFARVTGVAALFALTDHASVPFGSFFGDEEYFIKRSIWLRNIGLGIPIHAADLIYAFDEYSATSYLYVLAFVQVLVGPAPYGAHLVGIACYIASAVVSFRLVRRWLGRLPAFIGMCVLLFMPTLFAWSISALKDPLFSLMSSCTLVAAVACVRRPGWRQRVAALVVLVALAAVLATIRQAGGLITMASVATGLCLALLVSRPRLLLALMVVVPLVAGTVLHRPAVQLKVFNGITFFAAQHRGHVATSGWVYKLLDDRLYQDRPSVLDMHFDEAVKFLSLAIGRYLTAPFPWESRSMAMLAYLPELLVWYCLVALAIVGVPFAFRRDPVVTGLLVGYACVAALIVALTGGNVGTLVRHRGLALPYIVWLSAVGACDLLAGMKTRRRRAVDRSPEASRFMRVDPLWR